MKNDEFDSVGCQKFVRDHIEDCDKVLLRLEEVHLTLLAPKSIFRVQEVLVVGHMCGPYGRKPTPAKINAIQNMKHSNAIRRLKENLAKAPALKQLEYTRPIILTIHLSSIGIGWVISQLLNN